MLAVLVVELGHPQLAGLAGGAAELVAGGGEDGPRAIPLDPRRLDPGVDADGVVVGLVPHQLHSAVVEADGQNRAVGLHGALKTVVPLHADDLTAAGVALVAVQRDLGHGVAVAVVHVALALGRAEEEQATVRRPLHQGQRQTQLFAPQTVAVDTANDDGAVLVDDADLLAAGRPLHVAHDTLVAVVDHLLVPHAFMEHPDDDEPLLVAARQLLVLVVPGDAEDGAAVAF
mmetsp:Transcript_15803/g.28318  ORF Transcript_15803/g.28318 Transcript_15803/m.28318 type:complete len:230 (-) Transcript_15803:438-1127(-)